MDRYVQLYTRYSFVLDTNVKKGVYLYFVNPPFRQNALGTDDASMMSL